MVSEKEEMKNTAAYYIAKVAAAKTACQNTTKNMAIPESYVSINWSGTSGKAMNQALEDLHTEIVKAYVRLAQLERKMNDRVTSIYNNWP